MKLMIAAAAAALVLGAGSAANAQNGAGTTVHGGHICLWTYQIDHTKVVNPTTVLFYTKDGHVWQNTLKGPCPGLEMHGFNFMANADQICGPEIGIRILQTGQVCSLGEFSPAPEQHAAK